jgi:hypothetical protein
MIWQIAAPRAALFEADGGAWELEAKRLIFEFLKDKIGDKYPILY